MTGLTMANVGWLTTGIVFSVAGALLYSIYPAYGVIYVVIALVSLALSIVVVEVMNTYRRVFLKKGARSKKGSSRKKR